MPQLVYNYSGNRLRPIIVNAIKQEYNNKLAEYSNKRAKLYGVVVVVKYSRDILRYDSN